jgi:hypothetical protein
MPEREEDLPLLPMDGTDVPVAQGQEKGSTEPLSPQGNDGLHTLWAATLWGKARAAMEVTAMESFMLEERRGRCCFEEVEVDPKEELGIVRSI